MISPSTAAPLPAARLGSPADRLRELMGWYGAVGCLVESGSGRVLRHALSAESPPAAVVRAVLSGDAGHLDRALRRRRTLGLLPGGPVVTGCLENVRWPALRVPLTQVDHDAVGLWLLPEGAEHLSLDELGRLATEVDRLLAHPAHETGAAALLRCLEGEPDATLPEPLQGFARYCVAAVEGASTGEVSARVAAVAGAVPAVRACATGVYTYLVAGAGADDAGQFRRLLSAVVPGGAAPDGLTRAGMSEPVESAADLPAARRQADLAVAAVAPGSWASVSEVRGAVVLGHLARALDTLPDLGPDPLELLRRYDARRGAAFVATLRCWLDAAGDVSEAARALGIHANTVRYRLQRVCDITGVDVRRQVGARLELQVRLHQPVAVGAHGGVEHPR